MNGIEDKQATCIYKGITFNFTRCMCVNKQAPSRSQTGSFGTQIRTPKLEIKKDAKGMVTVPGEAPPALLLPWTLRHTS